MRAAYRCAARFAPGHSPKPAGTARLAVAPGDLGLLGLDPGEPHDLVPLVPVAVVGDPVLLLADDPGDGGRIDLSVPLDPHVVAHLVLVRLRRLHGLGADLGGRLGGHDLALDQAPDAVAGDHLVPDGVVAVVVD